MAPKTITVQLPAKADLPKSNEEAMNRFGDAITALQAKFAKLKADKSEEAATEKKRIRRSLRKLGFKMGDSRQRGVLVIEL